MDAQLYELFRPFAKMVAEEIVAMQQTKEEPVQSSRQLRGIPGIMKIFQCSRSKASRIKESGIIDSAITNVSEKIFLIDEKKALEAVSKRRNSGRNIRYR